VRLQWQLAAPERETGVHLRSIYRHWHRADLLGLSLSSLSVGSVDVEPISLERMNRFLIGGGGWSTASVDYWEARRVLDRVLALQQV